MAKRFERLDATGVGVETGATVRGKVDFVGGDGRDGRLLIETETIVVLTAPTPEQAEVLREFSAMLAATSRDGGRKRAAGTKPSWKVDKSHRAAIFSHLNKYEHGERVDPDSGQHPFVHLAWRALAIAWQETHQVELQPDTPYEEGR